MAGKLTPQQQRRIDEILEFQRTVDHIKSLVTELESSRAARSVVIDNICGSIARELSQLRQRAMTANVGTLADTAGALGVLAARSGGGINFKVRGLQDGVNSLNMQLDLALKMAQTTEPKDKDKDKEKKPS